MLSVEGCREEWRRMAEQFPMDVESLPFGTNIDDYDGFKEITSWRSG